nr:RNA polymerase sigma factor [Neobacillus sp. Marseille-Q6967]
MEPAQKIEKWFIQYEKDITQYLVYFTGTTDVEDLVQDTFLRAFQAYDQYRHDANPKTWLISIARNTAIDYFRKKSVWHKIKKLLDQDTSQRNEAKTEEVLLKKIEFAGLYKAINQLKPNYRDVILLKGISELSSRETGQVLGWSENKVNVTFYRAVKKLNQRLKDGEHIEQII